MRHHAIAALVPAALLAGVLAFAAADDTPKKPPTVSELMTAAHKGTDDKPSPLAIVGREVQREQPDWQAVVANTPPLLRLAAAIKGKEFGYRGPTKPYVDGVHALAAAAKQQDVAKARSAVAALGSTCARCHYGKRP